MSDLFATLSEDERQLLEERSHPSWIEPMLATLHDEPFSDDDWIYERKLDGERCLAFRHGSEVRLLSRNRKRLDETYPELVRALAAQPTDDFVVDGEVVAFEGNVTSFARLQERMHRRGPERTGRPRVAVFYYLFDIPYVAGRDTTDLPLRARKSLLKRALRFERPIRLTSHRNARGEEAHRRACDRGWEGVIAKDGGGGYAHGRSRSWLKLKCVNRQELVIGGFTDPQGEREGFGALLVGYHDGDELRYAGKVGTGFDDDTLDRLGGRLRDLERQSSPFAGDDAGGKGVHFVDPELVAEVGFTEWTTAGRLRHPRYIGLRRDKAPSDVVRETPGS